LSERIDTSAEIYQIECTGEQARIIQDSLELRARLSIGQFKEALEPACIYASQYPVEFVRELRELAERMENLWRSRSDLPTGIRAAKGDHAWEIHQTIRHRLSWDSVGNPPTRIWTGENSMQGVNFDEPMSITGKSFITIKKKSKPGKFGCHCDLEPGMKPDGCVLDEGRPNCCVYAGIYGDKSLCKYWQEIKEESDGSTL